MSAVEPWLYLKVFHAAPAEAERVLLDFVAPTACGLVEAGQVDRFFFLRYIDQGGFHVRFRLRVAAGRDPRALEASVHQAYRSTAGLMRVEWAVYEPELKKHGGPAGLEVAERQFFASSLFVLDCLPASAERLEIRVIMAAWSMCAVLRRALLGPAERRHFLEGYAGAWARLLAQMPPLFSGARAFEAPGAQDAAALMAVLLQGEGAFPTSCGLGPAAQRWLLDVEEDLARLADLSARGVLSGRFETVLFNIIHTHNNRLGLGPAEEAFTAELLLTADDGRVSASGVASAVQGRDGC